MKQDFKLRELGELFKESYKDWNEDDAYTSAAAVSYYAIFSLPAVLIIIIHVAGLFFGETAVHGKLSEIIGNAIGEQTAKQIQNILAHSSTQGNSTIMAIVGGFVLILSATSLFVQLQKALNKMWDVKIKSDAGIKKVLFDRTKTFGIILLVGFLFLISIAITGGLSFLTPWIKSLLPGFTIYILHIVNVLITLGIITCLFALIFKFLPDVNIEFDSVWIGAFVTAFLFMVGQYGLTLYFSLANPASAYGIAGSIILILLWVYYSCLLLFFGAEFTQVYAKKYNHQIIPTSSAIRITPSKPTESTNK